MKRFLTLLSAGALAFAMAGPAAAGGDTDMTAHPFAPRSSYSAGNLGGGAMRVRERDRRSESRNHRRSENRDHRRSQNRDYRRDRDHNRHSSRNDRRGFYNQDGHGWYNGHRGYRHRRAGYREYNGWWFPAAILGGAIIGNAIVNQPSSGSAHVQWCYDRYRSYRASDNTFQPYSGPRQQCVSPY